MSAQKGFVIAMDGPVAAGKGTVAPALAVHLGGFYLYTGATYRALALYCIQHHIDVTDREAVLTALEKVDVDLYDHTVILNGQDITEAIRRADVANAVPKVALLPEVRKKMVALQQSIANKRIAEGRIVVIEGRDTATVVFPDAPIKIFLTASAEIRARRRLEQYQSQGMTEATFEHVLNDLQERDRQDMEREVDPLVSDPEAHGYTVVDNGSLNEEQTIDTIVQLIRERNLFND